MKHLPMEPVAEVTPVSRSCAWVLYEGDAEVACDSKYLGPARHSNNFAEYQALVMLLTHLYRSSIRNVIIYSDSELVVNQTLGSWQINQPDLKVLATKCYGLLVQGCHMLKHCKGHAGNLGNERADELCNEVLDLNKEDYNGNKVEIV